MFIKIIYNKEVVGYIKTLFYSVRSGSNRPETGLWHTYSLLPWVIQEILRKSYFIRDILP